ncbi:MAG: c-type cytochrome [Gaiellaceae bacterium]|jgi:ubiquinol-cytochrome c reductase cytochrome c subunit
MKRVAVALLIALAVAPAAAADPPRSGIVHVKVPPGTSDVDYGAQLYGGNCVTCHGADGRGITKSVKGAGDVPGLGPSLRGVGALAADFYLRTGYMPLEDPNAQPRRSKVLFDERELRALTAYVASLGDGPAIPTPHPERGNLAAGLQLFVENCAGCHQAVAEGGYVTGAVAPPLEDATPTQIAEAIRIGPYLMPRFSEKRLSNQQVDSLIRYVKYAKHPDDRGGWSLGHVGPVPEGLITWFVGIAAAIVACLLIGKRLSG